MARTVGALTVSPERKAQIIAAALPRIAQGEPTASIGADYGIKGATLRLWLVSDASADADQARSTFLSEQLLEAIEAIDSSQDTIALARAREQFRAWSFLAERRAPALFGQRQEVHHTHDISDDLRAISERRRLASRQPIDVTPTTSSSDASQDRTE